MELTENGGDYVRRGFAKKRNDQLWDISLGEEKNISWLNDFLGRNSGVKVCSIMGEETPYALKIKIISIFNYMKY